MSFREEIWVNVYLLNRRRIIDDFVEEGGDVHEFSTIQLSVNEDDIALLTFDRPAVRNALNHEMVQDIEKALDALAPRQDLKALIFTGSEKSFVSGADISELVDRTRWDALRRINTGLFRRIEAFPAPTIAAIRGFVNPGQA